MGSVYGNLWLKIFKKLVQVNVLFHDNKYFLIIKKSSVKKKIKHTNYNVIVF